MYFCSFSFLLFSLRPPAGPRTPVCHIKTMQYLFTSLDEDVENHLKVLLFLPNIFRCKFRSYLPPQCPPELGISCVLAYWWSAGWGPMTGLRISSEFSSADGLFHLCHGHSQIQPSSGYLAGGSLYIDPTSVGTPVWHRTLTRTTDQFNLEGIQGVSNMLLWSEHLCSPRTNDIGMSLANLLQWRASRSNISCCSLLRTHL